MRPLVSVIIPAYNAAHTIGQCLDSLLAQTLSEIEVIVVDDGSEDETSRIVLERASYDPRVRLLRQKNQYAGVARNNGMEQASGKYLYFLDADDYVEPSCLERMTHAALAHDVDVVITRSTGLDTKTGAPLPLDYAMTGLPMGVTLGKADIHPALFQSFTGWPWDKLFRRDFIRETGLHFQSLRTTNDALFVFVALAEAKSIFCIEDPLVHHRMNNPQSLEGSRRKSYDCALAAIRAIHHELDERGLLASTGDSYNRWVANFLLWNVSTLPPARASELLDSASDELRTLPCERDYYPNERDADFVQAANLLKSELVLDSLDRREGARAQEAEIARLRSELDGCHGAIADLKAIITDLDAKVAALYASRSYRIGNAIVRPAASIRRRLHGPHDQSA